MSPLEQFLLIYFCYFSLGVIFTYLLGHKIRDPFNGEFTKFENLWDIFVCSLLWVILVIVLCMIILSRYVSRIRPVKRFINFFNHEDNKLNYVDTNRDKD